MNKLRILVVDEVPAWRDQLFQILNKGLSNYVSEISNTYYKTALNYINKERYDLIIVNLYGDDPSSPQSESHYSLLFLDAVRQSKINKNSVLIVLSTQYNTSRIKRALSDLNVY